MRSMDPGYPKPITIWKGIPESPQGAFVHKENGMQTHFCFNFLNFVLNIVLIFIKTILF